MLASKERTRTWGTRPKHLAHGWHYHNVEQFSASDEVLLFVVKGHNEFA